MLQAGCLQQPEIVGVRVIRSQSGAEDGDQRQQRNDDQTAIALRSLSNRRKRRNPDDCCRTVVSAVAGAVAISAASNASVALAMAPSLSAIGYQLFS